eukprot:1194796-Prorocentrum_minimum.AAC.4
MALRHLSPNPRRHLPLQGRHLRPDPLRHLRLIVHRRRRAQLCRLGAQLLRRQPGVRQLAVLRAQLAPQRRLHARRARLRRRQPDRQLVLPRRAGRRLRRQLALPGGGGGLRAPHLRRP